MQVSPCLYCMEIIGKLQAVGGNSRPLYRKGRKGGMRKKRKIPEYLGNSKQFMPLTYEMQKSAAWRSLSRRQIDLYCLAYREAHYGKRHPRIDFPDVDYLQGDDVCYLPFAVAVANGLYTEKSKTRFINDRKALINTGFLEIVSKGGQGNINKSIYKMSCNWTQKK